jgi:eukaryotic-like serine/threonine-protein kinase
MERRSPTPPPVGGKWETWVVPLLGGTPRPMFTNVAALSWIGDGRFLFSEIKRGLQMGVVTATAQHSDVQDVYVPGGMAHRSYASPDHRWVLIASEMNAAGWLPCRVTSMDRSEPARIVGPANGKCTYAAWSPDGQWMYFSAEVGDGFHIWRQKFPDGRPEQITFGASDEEGIAVWPDGRSFASSVGTTVSAIWIHDEHNDHQITSEGYGQLPSFSSDGNTFYYLLRISGVRQWAAGELWAYDLRTGNRERKLPGITLSYYDVSHDNTRVVFARTDAGREGIWVGDLKGARPPVLLSPQPDTRALFAGEGTVVFERWEGHTQYLFRMNPDGSERVKVTAEPINSLKATSPDGRWAVAWPAGDNRQRLVAYPIEGGDSLQICENCSDSDGGPAMGRTPPSLSWSRDGKRLYVRSSSPREPLYEQGKTYVLDVSNVGGLPPAFRSEAELASIPHIQLIPHGGIFPGPDQSRYAYLRAAIHRNIYRISVPTFGS